MTADLQSAIRNAEGALSVARDNEKLYEGLHRQWREEVKINLRVLERLREIDGGVPVLKPLDAAAQTAIAKQTFPSPMLETKPEPPEAAHGSPLTQEADGVVVLDRLAVRRRLRDWHVSYPLRVSYRTPSQMARQALTATLYEHPDYPKWLAKGGENMTSNKVTHRMHVLCRCAEFLGIDHHAVRMLALQTQRDIAIFGTSGVDYVWKD